MKKFITALAAAIALPVLAEEPADSVKGFVFTDVVTIPSTSVKNQNKSGTCWCFAGTGFIEDAVRKAKGDSLDLSEMFTVRHTYLEKARRDVQLQGHGNVSQGGAITDVTYIMSKYGAMPEELYRGLNYGEEKHNHNELSAAIEGYLKAVNAQKKPSTAWQAGLEGILDAYFGPVPETFEYQGKTYTPKSYAESLGLNFNDFIPFTSFTHHPYWSTFAIEVPDNWMWEQYYNVPLDVMKQIIDNALDNGYTINWAADVSEPGFRWRDGYAVLPATDANADLQGTELSRWVELTAEERAKKANAFTGPNDLVEMNVTPEVRQQMFENHETTDDHGMVIVGTAKDQTGKKYYKVKNSWDTDHVYGGYFYVSEPYLLAKTLSFMVNKNAVPKDVRKRLSL